MILILYASTTRNGQTNWNNSSAVADELFECLTILWGLARKGLINLSIYVITH